MLLSFPTPTIWYEVVIACFIVSINIAIWQEVRNINMHGNAKTRAIGPTLLMTMTAIHGYIRSRRLSSTGYNMVHVIYQERCDVMAKMAGPD